MSIISDCYNALQFSQPPIALSGLLGFTVTKVNWVRSGSAFITIMFYHHVYMCLCVCVRYVIGKYRTLNLNVHTMKKVT